VQIGPLDNVARAFGNQQSPILLVLMAATLSLPIGVAVANHRHLSRPILLLTAAAGWIRLGMLDNPVVATLRDEFGQLTGALERMR
jgi:nitrogen fixation/metabolism regulation signal transduction histidine kinase